MGKGKHTRKVQAEERRALKRQLQSISRETLCGILSELLPSYPHQTRLAVAAYAGGLGSSEYKLKHALFEALTLTQVQNIIDRAGQESQQGSASADILA